MGNKLSQEQMLPLGLITWYPWENKKKVLCIGENAGIFCAYLRERGLAVEANETLDIDKVIGDNYDLILGFRVIERAGDPVHVLKRLKKLLAPQGHLLLAMENRMGLRYFCGDKDPYTGRVFDGVENYRGYLSQDWKSFEGRLYAKCEMESFLQEAGLNQRQIFSILPGLEMPQQMYREDYLPEEELDIRYTPYYHDIHTPFLDEACLYTGIIKNGLFHQMANAYLIDCRVDGEPIDIKGVTTSMDRGPESAMVTLIREKDIVEKRCVFEAGKARISQLVDNTGKLMDRGIEVVPLEIDESGDCVRMPYVKEETALEYFRKLFDSDRQAFVTELDQYIDLLRACGEEIPLDKVDGNQIELAPIYEEIFSDMIPLNCFHTKDGRYVFFDQEFCDKQAPLGSVIVRTIDAIYMGNRTMEQAFSSSELFARYGVLEKVNIFRTIGTEFVQNLRQSDTLYAYNKLHRGDESIISANRKRMNYSEAQMKSLYMHPLSNTEGRKIFIFGSGLWARKFIAEFGYCSEIDGALDNNEEKSGQMIDGVRIVTPNVLKELDADEYKVIICVKHFNGIINQLNKLGVTNYSIYDPDMDWSHDFIHERMKDVVEPAHIADCNDGVGHYARGYVAGVFDLFHIGHLNVLKRAKAHCDYLIVGVVSDEQAGKNKLHSPYINEEERLEIVRSCKYVDEAFLLPVMGSDTRDVYKRFHFDAQFSGSDYEHDPYWLEKREWLRERGSELVFFPYTESTSSTKLKAAIEQK